MEYMTTPPRWLVGLVAALGLAGVACGERSQEPEAVEASGAEKPPAAAATEPSPTPSARGAPTIVPVDPGTAPAAVPLAVPTRIQALIAANDRTQADRELDAGRHPGELLAFFDVEAGMKVAEIFAGGGYTTELLARAVGKEGRVFAQNNQFVLDRFAAEPLAARLARPVNANVVRVDREYEAPLPPEATDLDRVVSVLVYHDTFWQGADRDAMNKAIFHALKPGGLYVVIDHSGRTGTGSSEVKTLHRVEESVVRAEIERAGFVLQAEGMFLRNPQDARDWNDAPSAAADRRGASDRFALRFVKPAR